MLVFFSLRVLSPCIILLISHYDHVQIEQVLMQNALIVQEASFAKMFDIPFHSSNP